jgi:uncharacterized NAD(P)/FAD-binding protein YdhS
MGAFPDEPQGFFSWLQQRELDSTGDAFVSRRLFGEYLKDLLTTYSKDAHHTTVTAIADSACDLTWDESRAQFRIDVAKTAQIHADFCVITVGNIEPIVPTQTVGSTFRCYASECASASMHCKPSLK